MTAIENLAKTLSRLPGIGPRSALRIAYAMINRKDEDNKLLAENIATIKDKVKHCKVCGSFSEQDICPVCSDASRDQSLLCIVENAQDVITIQGTGAYNGLFHVLGGAINPLGGVGPEDLNFASLLKRISEGCFKEVIIATNPTETGDTTAQYISMILKNRNDIILTRLASGLPIGGDLEYADKLTMARALKGRNRF